MFLLESSGICYVVFPKNCGPYLSIDKTSFSCNEDAHGKKGALVAIIEGVRSADITEFCDECGHDFIP